MTNSIKDLEKNIRAIHNKSQSHPDYTGQWGDGVLVNEINALSVECLNFLNALRQEPVAWRWKVKNHIGDGYIVMHESWRPSQDDAERSTRIEAIEALYTHPQPDSKLVEENAKLKSKLAVAESLIDFELTTELQDRYEALNKEGD